MQKMYYFNAPVTISEHLNSHRSTYSSAFHSSELGKPTHTHTEEYGMIVGEPTGSDIDWILRRL